MFNSIILFIFEVSKISNMTNVELNKLTIAELSGLNKRVIEMIKLKRLVAGKLNSDSLSIGMVVRYKGNSDRLQGEKFILKKINKVNAECRSLSDGRLWNINLANIEPDEKEVEN